MAEAARLARHPRAGAGRGARQRRAGTPRGVLPGLDGHAAAAAMGYGLRYEYGIFRQSIENGWQQERPDNWLRRQDPWEVARPNEQVEVTAGLLVRDARRAPGHRARACPPACSASPSTDPVVGYGGQTINTLRLWAAARAGLLRLPALQPGEFVEALAETLAAESLTRVLYPDDSTRARPGAALPAGVLPRRLLARRSGAALPAEQCRLERAAGEGRDPAQRHAPGARRPRADAHPARRGAARLGRGLGPHAAHARLHQPHAAARGAREVAARVVRAAAAAAARDRLRDQPAAARRGPAAVPGRRGTRPAREPDRGGRPRSRSAWPTSRSWARTAPTGSPRSTPSCCARTTVKDLAEIFPERFNNKTNGVTPRRWLLLANPALRARITDAIGDGWITDLEPARASSRRWPTTRRCGTRSARPSARPRTGSRHGSRPRRGRSLDPDTIVDCQVKRIHEYKRQLLNALRIVVLYDRLRENPGLDDAAANVRLRGQGGPRLSARQADHQVREQPGGHHRRRSRRCGAASRCCSCPSTRVSLAERLIPAADVSNQISTAGYEASGTSNMKFMMNGALTIGTRDGATIEMAEEAGEENFFLFGLTAQQVAESRGWYDPRWHYENEEETRAALDLIFCGPLQPRRAWRVRPAARHAARPTGPLHAPRRPDGAYLEADQRLIVALCRSGGLGGQGDPERRRLGEVLERPHHRGVCQGDLAGRAVSRPLIASGPR